MIQKIKCFFKFHDITKDAEVFERIILSHQDDLYHFKCKHCKCEEFFTKKQLYERMLFS